MTTAFDDFGGFFDFTFKILVGVIFRIRFFVGCFAFTVVVVVFFPTKTNRRVLMFVVSRLVVVVVVVRVLLLLLLLVVMRMMMMMMMMRHSHFVILIKIIQPHIRFVHVQLLWQRMFVPVVGRRLIRHGVPLQRFTILLLHVIILAHYIRTHWPIFRRLFRVLHVTKPTRRPRARAPRQPLLFALGVVIHKPPERSILRRAQTLPNLHSIHHAIMCQHVLTHHTPRNVAFGLLTIAFTSKHAVFVAHLGRAQRPVVVSVRRHVRLTKPTRRVRTQTPRHRRRRRRALFSFNLKRPRGVVRGGVGAAFRRAFVDL
mmetsp:Transcript_7293/g.24489  ORF Transcript_7293/g.24489 Transcript_7293/m.24489 type:complete len:314 (+) Transcript_7293:161-1102(+)